MIISEEDLKKRLESESNICSPSYNAPLLEVKKWKGSGAGRHTKSLEITGEEKIALGVSANLIGVSKAAQNAGLNPGVVSKIVNGKSTTEEQDRAIAQGSASIDDTIAERAADRLLTTLNFLSDDKLANANAKDASAIAANLSKVRLNIRGGSASSNTGPQVMIILNQPKPAREDHFDSIEVRE